MSKSMILDYETTGLCPHCAKESPAHYESNDDGVVLIAECPDHGAFTELAEKDRDSFLWGYEQEYEKPHDHLALPVTYRCNLTCEYCYTLSNTKHVVPDRPFGVITDIVGSYNGNLSLIGGEPTVREDLPEIIAEAKAMPNIDRVSVCTNGQRLKDMRYLSQLREAGLDFVFFSFNDVEYDMSSQVHSNKLQALENCYKLRVPVWLQGTISDIHQLDSIVLVLREFKKVIFSVTLRAAKAFGINHPAKEIFVSDILEYLGKKENCLKGTSPFNRRIKLEGKFAKVCSWVHDMRRVDPVDSDYVISDDTMTKFHRGMRVDEVLLRQRLFGKGITAPSPERVKEVLRQASV
jgi:MoaA/NifB/PqqE/SkfB family radical SAM enzyme